MPYHLPTAITFGDGCLRELRSALVGDDRIALFATDRTQKALGNTLEELLAGKTVQRWNRISPEPPPKELFAAAAWLKETQPDAVVAIGGGSVMDLAKAAAFCATQAGTLESILAGLPESPLPPMRTIAVPTTAGTGSEVTPFVVFWDHETKQKYSFAHDLLYPAVALVDPELTSSMPPHVTACTGMDAFTQACEAYWNVHHNPTSDAFALEAVRLIEPTLPAAVADGSDVHARHDMMLGSLTAGKAFSNTRTAACHSISYPMTLHYAVPHGQAVGVTLPEVLRLNATAMEKERTEQFCAGFGASSIEEVCDRIRTMMTASGLKTRLSELGIDEQGIEIIVREGFTVGRMGNNPYAFTQETLRDMLKRIA